MPSFSECAKNDKTDVFQSSRQTWSRNPDGSMSSSGWIDNTPAQLKIQKDNPAGNIGESNNGKK